MTLDDECVEVLGLLLREAVESEVIEDEQVGCKVAAEGDFEAVVGTRLAELAEQKVGATEEDRVVCPRCGSTERLGEEGLAHADRADEEDVLPALEELEREEFIEMAAIDLDGRRPVEALEGDTLLEACGEEPAFEGEVVAALDLVGKDERKKRGIVELLGNEPVRGGQGAWEAPSPA